MQIIAPDRLNRVRKSRTFSCCTFNAQSIVNKLCELHHILYTDKFDLVFITESWLHAGISSGLLDPEGQYYVIRKDRTDIRDCVRGGGVCVFASRALTIAEVSVSTTYDFLELVCFDLLYGKTKLRYFVVYRPPNSDIAAEQYVDLLIDCLTMYTTGAHINIITGDLNCPRINWQQMCCPQDYIHTRLFDFVLEAGFCQFVDFPTRGSNVLDVILADDDQIVTAVRGDPPIGHSDHLMIKFTMVLDSQEVGVGGCNNNRCVKSTSYNWHLADFSGMHDFLSATDWYWIVCNNPSAEAQWETFLNVIRTAVDLFVPKFKNGSSTVFHRHKHYPRNIHNLAIKKRKLWKKCRLNPHDPVLRNIYRDCVKNWHQQLKSHEKEIESEVIESDNLGAFYKHVNRRITYRKGIGTLIDKHGNLISEDSEKAALFNAYFAAVGTVDDGRVPVCDPVASSTCVIENVVFTTKQLKVAMGKLKNNLSSGPDGLPPLLFKHLAHCLAEPLALIFNQLLSAAYVPTDWKKAIITPVFKKGVAGCVSNYRPISLTCVPSKLMERVLAQQIYEHMVKNNILHHAQHGFCKGKSTATNLLEALNDWTLAIQDRHSVTVAYIDFSKAFDTVCHKKLFVRLASYGIGGNLLEWLCQFFCARSHQTRVGSSLSSSAELLSGVVQGSGIGPLMFLLFINELAELLESMGITVKLFADDIKAYVRVVGNCDADRLQYALELLASWIDIWQLTISVEKCCIMNIGHLCLPVRDFKIKDCMLSTVTSCRDLGVIVSNNLKPSTHIGQMVAKAHQRAGAILRCFVSRDVKLLVKAFTVYVRPLVEYNSVVWSPCSIQDIMHVERVQRRFTKALPGFKTLSYSSRLKKLDLPSLEKRRLHSDLIMCYKIIFGIVNICTSDFFHFHTVMSTRGHPYKLFKERSTNTVRNNLMMMMTRHEFSFSQIHSLTACMSSRLDFSTVPRI